MSKKSRSIKKARAEVGSASVATVRGPADTVSVIPYLLGYEPHESLVLVSLTGTARRFGPSMRLDLVDVAMTPTFVDYVCGVVADLGWESVVAVVYSESPPVAEAVLPALALCLTADGIEVVDAVATGGGRWRSFSCLNPDCCPPEGTPFDPSTSISATRMVAAGRSKARDRESLRSQLAPAPGDLRSAVGAICESLLADREDRSESRWNRAEVEQRVTAAFPVDSLGEHECGELLAMVQSISLRDTAWMMMTRDNADEHYALWRQVTRLAPDRLLAPAGSLAGFAAWIAGNGVLASHAADRVAEVAPAYSMMLLLREVLDRCVNPDVWDTTFDKPRFVS